MSSYKEHLFIGQAFFRLYTKHVFIKNDRPCANHIFVDWLSICSWKNWQLIVVLICGTPSSINWVTACSQDYTN